MNTPTNRPERKLTRYTQQKLSSKRTPPTEYALFTGGKLPGLAIGFNIATDNVNAFIKTIQPIDEPLKNIDQLNDKTLVYLRHYLWKGNMENKNTSGYELDIDDKEIIKGLLKKTAALRDFHSHYWHDNEVITFDSRLKQFIINRHDWACAKLLNEKNADASLYYDQIEKYGLFDGNRITQDGRFFLLSFFLNKGQMQSLLQQRKGSKRNDVPEYIFKHKVYTFYCHREGAAWDSFGVNNDTLTQASEEEQRRILSGRNAYKILSYLNDRPTVEHEKKLPLILASGRHVADMGSLIQFTTENDLLPDFAFYEKDEQIETEQVDEKINEKNKLAEHKKREGYRCFRAGSDTYYEFEISYAALRQIVTDIYVDAHNTDSAENLSRNHFIGVLNDCMEMRAYIYEQLKKCNDAAQSVYTLKVEKKYSSIYIDYSNHTGSIQEKHYTANEWRNIPISATPKVEQLLIEWHTALASGTEEKPNNNEITRRKKLLNSIRPGNEKFDMSPYNGMMKNGRPKAKPEHTDAEPLQFHLAYYYREQSSKNRKTDQFLEWGTRYLIDAGLMPDWFFEMEQLSYGKKPGVQEQNHYSLKKEKVWEQKIPENMRLRIIDNHLNVGIKDNGTIQRLRIGEQVMKYLLCWQFAGDNSTGLTINDFLKATARDLCTIYGQKGNINFEELQLMEPFAVPPLLYKTREQAKAIGAKQPLPYKQQVLQFLKMKIDWLAEMLERKMQLNRNEKNEVILQAYRLFDFGATEGKKFLRKNEYEQMSVCHYMLYQQKHKIHGLIKGFNLQKRLPKELYEIMNKTIAALKENMDDLFDKVLINRKEHLKDLLENLRHDTISRKKVEQSTAYLNIRFEDNTPGDPDGALRDSVRTDSLRHIPFAVHPALTLKYFYPKQFRAQVFTSKGNSKEHVFYKLRQDERWSGALGNNYLDEREMEKILEEYQAAFPADKALKSYSSFWKGYKDDLKTKDILLVRIAQYYLNQYDINSARELGELISKKQLKLDKWLNEPITLKMQIPQEMKAELSEKGNAPKDIYLSLRVHQFDDYFFRAERERLVRLAIFFINWRKEELALYGDNEEVTAKINDWRDGTAEKPITMGELVEARRINADQAQELTQYYFDYEKRILEQLSDGSSDNKQKVLMSIWNNQDGRPHLKFWQVQNKDKTLDEDIKYKMKELRNTCLHNLIPITGSLRKQVIPGSELANVLHINKRLGKDRTAENIYLVGK